jgi:S-adenosylmethionine:tRNA ribosyltransferase-isomerase
MVLEVTPEASAITRFFEIGRFLHPNELLVGKTDTRFSLRRFFGSKLPGGGRGELLLLKKLDDLTWECLVGGRA